MVSVGVWYEYTSAESNISVGRGGRAERTNDTKGPPDAIVYEGPGLFSETNDVAFPYAVLGREPVNGIMAITVPVPISVVGAVCGRLSNLFAVIQCDCAFCATEEPLVGYWRGDVQPYDVAGDCEDRDSGHDETRVQNTCLIVSRPEERVWVCRRCCWVRELEKCAGERGEARPDREGRHGGALWRAGETMDTLYNEVGDTGRGSSDEGEAVKISLQFDWQPNVGRYDRTTASS